MRNKNVAKESTTIIGKGCTIKDNIVTSNGPIIFEGDFTGTVVCQHNTVTIGSDGYIDGTINADTVDIAGVFEGNISAALVHIEESGVVNGQVHTTNIIIDEGGKLNGNVDMKVDDKLTTRGEE